MLDFSYFFCYSSIKPSYYSFISSDAPVYQEAAMEYDQEKVDNR